MQEVRYDGTRGEPIPFDKVGMDDSLNDANVSHVEVFKYSDGELAARRKLARQQPTMAQARSKRKRKNKQARKQRRK